MDLAGGCEASDGDEKIRHKTLGSRAGACIGGWDPGCWVSSRVTLLSPDHNHDGQGCPIHCFRRRRRKSCLPCLVVTRRAAHQFQPVERALARQRLLQLALAAQQTEQRIRTQLLVVVHVKLRFDNAVMP